mgnify:FL=1
MIRNIIFFILIFIFSVINASSINVPYTQLTLKNGLNVILHEDHSLPLISVNIWYHVGSSSEKSGRTGFAHLFEHILFEKSTNVPEGKFIQWIESRGGRFNGSTTQDRTNYFEDIPSNSLELALFLESDRMGFMLDVVTPELVDGQREVVKNERRQRYENQPYGRLRLALPSLLYDKNHPYSWPVIGSMDDLNAASDNDFINFYNDFYAPSNASMVIAGDFNTKETIKLIEHWFSDVPAGKKAPKISHQKPSLSLDKRVYFEDKVNLPLIHISWLTPPFFDEGDAELDILANILGGGKNSRLYKRLVYEEQIVQNISVYQSSQKLSSTFNIQAFIKPGVSLDEVEVKIYEEINKLFNENPSEREVQRGINQFEAYFIRSMEMNTGSSGKADALNRYYFYTGEPNYFNQDLNRYLQIKPEDISFVAKKYLSQNKVTISIVPEGQKQIALKNSNEITPK